MQRICPKCQHANPEDQLACTSCGWSMNQPYRADAPPPDDPASKMAAPPAQPDGPEHDLWCGRTSLKHAIGSWMLLGLGVIALLVVTWMARHQTGWTRTALVVLPWLGVLVISHWLMAKTFYIRFANRYRLTTERLFIERGLLSKTTDQTELVRVDDVRVHQGLIDRVFRIGNVIIISADASHGRLTLPSLCNPMAVAEHIRTQTRHLRKRGLFIENLQHSQE